MDYKRFELNKLNHQALNPGLCLALLLLALPQGLVKDFKID